MVSMLDLAVVLTLSIGMHRWFFWAQKVRSEVLCAAGTGIDLLSTLVGGCGYTYRILPLPIVGQPAVPLKKGASQGGRARAVDLKWDLVLAVEGANFEILCCQKTVFSVIWLHLFLGVIWIMAKYVLCSALNSELCFAHNVKKRGRLNTFANANQGQIMTRGGVSGRLLHLLPLASPGHSIGRGDDPCPDVTRPWSRRSIC